MRPTRNNSAGHYGAWRSAHLPELTPVIVFPAIPALTPLDPAIGKIDQTISPPPVEARTTIHQAVLPLFIFAQRVINGPRRFSMVIHDALPIGVLSRRHCA
jgi:hypothetical protein